jgi:hypothetical protein
MSNYPRGPNHQGHAIHCLDTHRRLTHQTMELNSPIPIMFSYCNIGRVLWLDLTLLQSLVLHENRTYQAT